MFVRIFMCMKDSLRPESQDIAYVIGCDVPGCGALVGRPCAGDRGGWPHQQRTARAQALRSPVLLTSLPLATWTQLIADIRKYIADRGLHQPASDQTALDMLLAYGREGHSHPVGRSHDFVIGDFSFRTISTAKEKLRAPPGFLEEYGTASHSDPDQGYIQTHNSGMEGIVARSLEEQGKPTLKKKAPPEPTTKPEPPPEPPPTDDEIIAALDAIRGGERQDGLTWAIGMPEWIAVRGHRVPEIEIRAAWSRKLRAMTEASERDRRRAVPTQGEHPLDLEGHDAPSWGTP